MGYAPDRNETDDIEARAAERDEVCLAAKMAAASESADGTHLSEPTVPESFCLNSQLLSLFANFLSSSPSRLVSTTTRVK